MSRKAIISIVLGESYVQNWKQYAEGGWRQYAKKHGYDVIIHDRPLDTSERAQNRSIAWQKCLVLTEEIRRLYERVVWIDSDILINHFLAPDIMADCPPDRIGGIDAYSFITRELFQTLHERKIKYVEKFGFDLPIPKTGREFYTDWGIHTGLDEVISTGVLILNPELHHTILEKTYSNYEDKGAARWLYEERPLSYEIVKAGKHHFIDHRFNVIFSHYLFAFYPHLLFGPGSSELPFFQPSFRAALRIVAATSAFAYSYFLHFAGGWKVYQEYVNQDRLGFS